MTALLTWGRLWTNILDSEQCCALFNGPLKLTADGRKGIFHSHPAFHIFTFSLAALWSQTLAGHTSLTKRLFFFTSRHHPVVLLLESAVNTKPASRHSPHTPYTNTYSPASYLEAALSQPLWVHSIWLNYKITEYTCGASARSGGIQAITIQAPEVLYQWI